MHKASALHFTLAARTGGRTNWNSVSIKRNAKTPRRRHAAVMNCAHRPAIHERLAVGVEELLEQWRLRKGPFSPLTPACGVPQTQNDVALKSP